MSDRRIEILNQRLAAAGETDLAIIDAAELARLRKNSERWEWVERNVTVPPWFSGCCVRTDNTMSMTECVDAAIAAEKRPTMSEPIAVAAQLVRGEWADETAEGASGALEKLTDLMREAGVMIRDQYDELVRLRKNSERWEWCKRNFRGRFGHLRIEFAGEVVHADPQAAVDAAIAAEKGK